MVVVGFEFKKLVDQKDRLESIEHSIKLRNDFWNKSL